MKHILSLAQLPMDQYLPLVHVAEEVGFGGIHLADHVVMPGVLRTEYPQRGSSWPPDRLTPWPLDAPWVDCWTMFAAMGAVTSHIDFYTGVHILPMRHPLHVAKSVGTVAALTGGRVRPGFGVGWLKDEFEACGEDFATRGKRLDEAIEILRGVWAGRFSFEGVHYRFEAIDMLPLPEVEIPILVGGESEVGLRRAAELAEGFVFFPHRLDTYERLIGTIDSMRRAARREHVSFEYVTMPSDVESAEDMRALEKVGAHSMIVRPWPEARNGTSLESKVVAIKDYAMRMRL